MAAPRQLFFACVIAVFGVSHAVLTSDVSRGAGPTVLAPVEAETLGLQRRSPTSQGQPIGLGSSSNPQRPPTSRPRTLREWADSSDARPFLERTFPEAPLKPPPDSTSGSDIAGTPVPIIPQMQGERHLNRARDRAYMSFFREHPGMIRHLGQNRAEEWMIELRRHLRYHPDIPVMSYKEKLDSMHGLFASWATKRGIPSEVLEAGDLSGEHRGFITRAEMLQGSDQFQSFDGHVFASHPESAKQARLPWLPRSTNSDSSEWRRKRLTLLHIAPDGHRMVGYPNLPMTAQKELKQVARLAWQQYGMAYHRAALILPHPRDLEPIVFGVANWVNGRLLQRNEPHEPANVRRILMYLKSWTARQQEQDLLSQQQHAMRQLQNLQSKTTVAPIGFPRPNNERVSVETLAADALLEFPGWGRPSDQAQALHPHAKAITSLSPQAYYQAQHSGRQALWLRDPQHFPQTLYMTEDHPSHVPSPFTSQSPGSMDEPRASQSQTILQKDWSLESKAILNDQSLSMPAVSYLQNRHQRRG